MMPISPFLTDLDSRAAIKGSRDPLGCQSVWTRFGRRVVGNLSTVSSSLRDFTVLLLGYYFVQRVVDEQDGAGRELEIFLKWEQLAAYSRAVGNDDWSFRGTERIRKFLNESSTVVLSDQRAHQILGNQKIYGLWGLYTVPARSSEMLEKDSIRLTPPALGLVEGVYLPMLAKAGFRDGTRIINLLCEKDPKLHARGRHKQLLEAIASILRPGLLPTEQDLYRDHLLYGGPEDSTEGRQKQLARLIVETLDDNDFQWSPARIRDLAEKALGLGDEWRPLADRLERIRHCESVLAPMSELFNHLLGCDGQETAVISKRLKEVWGDGLDTIDIESVRLLRAEFGGGVQETADRWMAISEAARGGDYGGLIELLLLQSKAVMQNRGGSAWVDIQKGRLCVRLRDEKGWLWSKEDLAGFWKFPYFLNSLRTIASAVREPRDD